MSKCLVETCFSKEAADCRGLCMKCYSTAKKHVASGETTWERLEEIGLARSKAVGDKFTQQFLKKNTEGA